MTSRERIQKTLQHELPDRVPCDFGGCSVTGMHASVIYRLRQALRMDPPGTPVKVIDPFQMLGELAPDLLDALGVDTIELPGTDTFFGFPKANWKPWTCFDGTPVLVPGGFTTELASDGRIYMYPQGDRSAPPSGVMPSGGLYFDAIHRTPMPAEADLRVEDNVEEFGLLPDEELAHFERESRRLYEETDRALFASLPGGGLGDMAWLPAPFLKHPRGLREPAEWLASLVARPDFIRAVFEKQCAIALQNLERLFEAAGNRLSVLFVSGADYGMQAGPQIAPWIYEEAFLPYYAKVNGWIHAHTTWKTFVHSCGAIEPLLPYFIQAGFDILNPVQCSAAGMEPSLLKQKYGRQLVFWGGGVDTQRTLPFGSPDEVRREVRERVRILGEGGGFVFNAVHNVQPGTPVENILAMLETFQECRDYS